MNNTFRAFLDRHLKENPRFKKRWDDSAPRRNLIKQLLKARIEKKLTQQQLAVKAETTQAEIARIENGYGNPRLDTLLRIAGALDQKLNIQDKECLQREITVKVVWQNTPLLSFPRKYDPGEISFFSEEEISCPSKISLS